MSPAYLAADGSAVLSQLQDASRRLEVSEKFTNSEAEFMNVLYKSYSLDRILHEAAVTYSSEKNVLLCLVQRVRKTGEVERARFTELVKLLTDKLTACEERARDRTTKYLYIKSTTVYVPSSELGLFHPLSR